MPDFTARVMVVHIEEWAVEASDMDDARKKFTDLHDDVVTDDTGGETVDWELIAINEVK